MAIDNYSDQLADNITNHNALLKFINSKGNKTPADGGVTILQNLEYAQNSTVKWYAGYEALDVSAQDVFTTAQFNWKQMAGNVVISGLEQIQNSGASQKHDLLKSRIRNLEKSLKNTFATSLYADGTGTNGKDLGGLQLLVADTVTNTVGGINANTYSFWQNQLYDFSVQSVTAGADTITLAMNTLWLLCIRGADRPDFIAMDSVYFNYYWQSLQAGQRFAGEKSAAAGFMNLMYMDAPVVYDDQCPASHGYFLNTDYLFLRPAPGREFKALKEKASINQDAIVLPVVWAGNMTTSNRSLQGVMHA